MENNKEILAKIHSGDEQQIAEAIQEIQEKGDMNIAEILLQQLGEIKEPRLATIISNLLADIKDNKFKEILTDTLMTTSDAHLKTALLRIVWESPIDYSAYLDIFLKFLQDEDFTVAFEASTVIENMVHNLSEDQIQNLCQTIDQIPEDKHFLIENIQEEISQREEN